MSISFFTQNTFANKAPWLLFSLPDHISIEFFPQTYSGEETPNCIHLNANYQTTTPICGTFISHKSIRVGHPFKKPFFVLFFFVWKMRVWFNQVWCCWQKRAKSQHSCYNSSMFHYKLICRNESILMFYFLIVLIKLQWNPDKTTLLWPWLIRNYYFHLKTSTGY